MDTKPMILSPEEVEDIRDRLTRIEKSLEDLVNIYNNLQGFLKVLNWVGIASTWIAKISALMAIVYAALKHIPPPK